MHMDGQQATGGTTLGRHLFKDKTKLSVKHKHKHTLRVMPSHTHTHKTLWCTAVSTACSEPYEFTTPDLVIKACELACS